MRPHAVPFGEHTHEELGGPRISIEKSKFLLICHDIIEVLGGFCKRGLATLDCVEFLAKSRHCDSRV